MSTEAVEYRPDRAPLVPPGRMDLQARDITATFSADVTLAEAQRKLAEIGQWLAVDGDGSWTLGRLVQTNSTRPLRLGYGAWRDLLLGSPSLNGRGGGAERGPVRVVDRAGEEAGGLRGAVCRGGAGHGWDAASGPPVKLLEFSRNARLPDCAADAAFGIVVGITQTSNHEASRAAARSVGGSVYFVEAGRTHADLDEAGCAGLRRLKMAIRPAGKLQ